MNIRRTVKVYEDATQSFLGEIDLDIVVTMTGADTVTLSFEIPEQKASFEYFDEDGSSEVKQRTLQGIKPYIRSEDHDYEGSLSVDIKPTELWVTAKDDEGLVFSGCLWMNVE